MTPGPSADQVEAHVRRAAAAHARGGAHAEAAEHLLAHILRQPGSATDCAPALQLYAQVAAGRQQWRGVALAAVRLLALQPENAGAQQLLARALQDGAGMAQVLADVGGEQTPAAAATGAGSSGSEDDNSHDSGQDSSGDSAHCHHGCPAVLPAAAAAPPHAQPCAPASRAAALALLARTAAGQGALQPAVCLYSKAVQLDPQSAACALGLAQALEACNEFGGVLRVALAFCDANAGVRIGPVCLRGVRDLAALRRMRGVPCRAGELRWLQQDQLQQEQLQEQQLQEGEQPAPQQQQQQRDLSLQAGSSGAVDACSSQSARVLALLLTAAKVLFCGGALAAAQQLLSWLEPLEAAVAAARHQSQHGHAAPGVSIRNELAYSQLLRRLLQPCLRPALPAGARRADDASSEATPRALYICGDSHVLPAAWRAVSVWGEPRLLVPLLVTGCKAWHLRRGSGAACAAQLRAALAGLPAADGADVLLLLGGIDCSEGLVQALAKGKYESAEQAVHATVRVYVEALTELAAQSPHLRTIIVHPVPPLPKLVRSAAAAFNAALAQQLAQQHKQQQQQQQQQQQGGQSRQAAAGCKVLWLAGLCEAWQTDAAQDAAAWWQFDGVHLGPGYVADALCPALEQLPL